MPLFPYLMDGFPTNQLTRLLPNHFPSLMVPRRISYEILALSILFLIKFRPNKPQYTPAYLSTGIPLYLLTGKMDVQLSTKPDYLLTCLIFKWPGSWLYENPDRLHATHLDNQKTVYFELIPNKYGNGPFVC